MANTNNKNSYYRQLKNGKLKFFTVLYLRYRGKKDAELHIIRANEKGQYISPFIAQEIHLYEAAVKLEQEVFINTLIQDQIQIKLAHLQATAKETQKQQYQNTDNTLSDNERFHDLERSITAINSQEQEMSLLKRREKEILQLRCDQLYSILLAKLSVYWSGVLKANSEEQTIPPVFVIDDYLPIELYCSESLLILWKRRNRCC